jgi:hypothetical protein
MLYVKIGNTYLYTYHTWNYWASSTWGDLALLTWKEVYEDQRENDGKYVLANTMNILDIVNDQSTCDLKVYDESCNGDFRKGMPITILNDECELTFAGFVDSVIKKQCNSGSDIAMEYEIAAIDNHYLVNKRKMIRAFVAQTIDVAVTWILDNILAVEGITLGVITPTTKLITKSYNYIGVRDVLDELAEYAAYVWFISADKKLCFIPGITYTAPFDIILDEYGYCEHVKDESLTVSDENSEYRNSEYLIGSTNKSVLQTQTFKGDGEIQTWTVRLPIVQTPVVKLNGVIKTVGINVVNTGYDFYWNEGDPTINQDSLGTKLTNSDILTVEFYGMYPIVVKSSNFAEITAKATLEGSSGIVEDAVNDTAYKTKDDAIERANILIETYGIDAHIINYTTFEEGIEAGQLQHVYSTIHNIDHDCIVTQVQKQEVDYAIEYFITIISGPTSDYWVKQMLNISNAKNKALQDSIETSNVLLILLTFDKDWTAIERPNIFLPLYPSESLFPGSDGFPCFDTNECCSYAQINISGGYRLYMTDQVITASKITTTFIVPSQDCNGSFTELKLFGGAMATETIDSGELLSTHAMVYTKNNLESFQIVVEYNKW